MKSLAILCLLAYLFYMSVAQEKEQSGAEEESEEEEFDESLLKINCTTINRDIDIEEIMNMCYNDKDIAGLGSVKLGSATERTLHDFFLNKEYVNVSILIDSDTIARTLYLGGVRRIYSTNPGQISLFIENTDLMVIDAPYLEEIGSMKVRGNRYLTPSTMQMLRMKAARTSQHFIQPDGECTFYETENPNLAGCETVNDLFLLEGESIPANFTPTRIGGCVNLNSVDAEHDFLKKVDIKHLQNFDCDGAKQQAIIDNPSVCLKEYEYYLDKRNIEHTGNGNSDCKFKCYEGIEGNVNDISDMKQRWCETLEGDLIINDDLAEQVDIRELIVNLKSIIGKIVIANLTFEGAPINDTIYELNFGELTEVTGGPDDPEILVYVNNTILQKLTFPKIISMQNAEKAFVVTEHNDNLTITKEQLLRLEVAANGRAVAVKKKAVMKNEVVEEKEEETDHKWLIIGCVTGGVATLILLTALIVVLVLRLRKSKKGKLKNEFSDDKNVRAVHDTVITRTTSQLVTPQNKSQDRSSQRGCKKAMSSNAKSVSEKNEKNEEEMEKEPLIVEKAKTEKNHELEENPMEQEETQKSDKYEQVQTTNTLGKAEDFPLEAGSNGYEVMEKQLQISKAGKTNTEMPQGYEELENVEISKKSPVSEKNNQ